jgi:hypothetical protein
MYHEFIKQYENERLPKAGEFYRHFKNNYYQIAAIAIHSETDEPLVVYQALYGDCGIYARPLEMFLSEVDHEKYPDVTQKFRFEKIDRTELFQDRKVAQTEAALHQEDAQNESVQPKFETVQPESEGLNPWLAKFLDADTYEEKGKVLREMKNDVTDRLINDMAVIMDVVIPEGALSERYRQLCICTDTHAKYETTRFR